MADYTITLPVGITKAAMRDAICTQYKYQETIMDTEGNEIPNPESNNQFAARMLIEWFENIYTAVAAKEADSYRVTAITTAKTKIAGIVVE